MPAKNIIDHYLIREVLQPFVVICTALVVIFITFSLSRLLIEADAGLLQPAEVARLTLFKSIISLDVLLPLTLTCCAPSLHWQQQWQLCLELGMDGV